MEIPFRKSKNIGIYMAGFLLVLVALFFIFNPPKTLHPVLGSPIFFGALAGILLVAAWRLFQTAWHRMVSKKPGMRVNEQGLEDFSSKINQGFISWSEVDKLEIKEVVSSKFIVVYLNNPEHYINSQKDGWRKRQLIDRYKNYGSPYCVATTSLETNTKALYDLLEEYKTRFNENAIA
ncbi:MAG TPA: STM3941 family protein [Flavobacteriaceae bacterium]|nr:STM3941 family protein [Flavobacteriaceae bacterium]